MSALDGLEIGWLRSRGVPGELYSRARVPPEVRLGLPTEQYEFVYVIDDDDLHGPMNEAELRLAARAGLGVAFSRSSRPDDLERLVPFLSSGQALVVDGRPGLLSGWSAIETATGLKSLSVGFDPNRSVDLSGLASLTSLSVRGGPRSSWESGLQLPALKHLSYESTSKALPPRVLGALESLTFESAWRLTDLDFVEDLSRLRWAKLWRGGRFDARTFVRAPRLEFFALVGFDALLHAASLRDLRQLRKVHLASVRAVDDPMVFAELSLDEFMVEGNFAFDQSFVAHAGNRAGRWFVGPFKASVDASSLRMTPASFETFALDRGRVQVRFDDWALVERRIEALGAGPGAVDSHLVEELFSGLLSKDGEQVEFDSEGSMVAFVCADILRAEEAIRVLVERWNSKTTFDQSAKRVLRGLGY